MRPEASADEAPKSRSQHKSREGPRTEVKSQRRGYPCRDSAIHEKRLSQTGFYAPSHFANDMPPLKPVEALIKLDIICPVVVALGEEKLIVRR